MYQRGNLEWRKVPGTEDYYVSNYGDLARTELNYIDTVGRHLHYDKRVFWSEDQFRYGGSHGKDYKGGNIYGHRVYMHRVTALAFVPNPNNKPEINHIDGDTKNNYVGCVQNNYEDSNLEWVTRKENMEHASRIGLINRDSELRKEAAKKNRLLINYDAEKRPVVQLDKNGTYITDYESSMEASRQTGIQVSTILDCCRHGKYRKSAGGYQWVYKEEYNPNNFYIYHNNSDISNARPIEQYDMEGNFIAEYASILEACRVTGWSGNSYISEVCNGKRKHYKNCIWKYKNSA